MKKKREAMVDDDFRPEYDPAPIRGRVRGKYAQRYRAGTNLVWLAPDVAAAFPDAQAVNEALRLLMGVAKSTVGNRALNSHSSEVGQ